MLFSHQRQFGETENGFNFFLMLISADPCIPVPSPGDYKADFRAAQGHEGCLSPVVFHLPKAETL